MELVKVVLFNKLHVSIYNSINYHFSGAMPAPSLETGAASRGDLTCRTGPGFRRGDG
jgi:hypothetical protein